MRLIKFLTFMPRTRRIVDRLKEKYNFDVSEDMPTIVKILNFIGASKLSNEQIVDAIMEIHTIRVEDLYPAGR